jgi:hypothetical protein
MLRTHTRTAFVARAVSIPTGCALNCSFALGSRPAGKAMSDEDMKAELDRLRNEKREHRPVYA